jgi:iron complex transport system ATP-binding protein
MAEPAAEAISARDVRVELSGRPVLHGVDASVRHGETLAILGPNGAGKSTLLRAFAGLVAFTGSIRIDGDDVASLPPKARAQRLAFVPQVTALRAALPVRDVVLQGRFAHREPFARETSADRKAVERALELTDAARFARRAFTTLSFGEQRRVLIARGLASGARIVCLDEPTAALDVGHALQLHALLQTLAQQGYAVVLVLHALGDARAHADRALLLAQGRVVSSGSVTEVIASDHVRAVYGVEMREREGLAFSLPGGEP